MAITRALKVEKRFIPLLQSTIKMLGRKKAVCSHLVKANVAGQGKENRSELTATLHDYLEREFAARVGTAKLESMQVRQAC